MPDSRGWPWLDQYRYNDGLEFSRRTNESFYSYLMAAFWKADSDNLRRLTEAFPGFKEEMTARYVAPGGLLPGESMYDESGRKVSNVDGKVVIEELDIEDSDEED